jgi:hypothetical protein
MPSRCFDVVGKWKSEKTKTQKEEKKKMSLGGTGVTCRAHGVFGQERIPFEPRDSFIHSFDSRRWQSTFAFSFSPTDSPRSRPQDGRYVSKITRAFPLLTLS